MNIVTQQLTEEMIARRNEVAMLVASLTGVPVDDIMGRSRRQDIADARKLVMWTLAVMLGYTRNNVGILMERNQSAVTYAVRCVNEGYGGKDVERLRQEIEKKLKTIPTVAKNATVKRKETKNETSNNQLHWHRSLSQ